MEEFVWRPHDGPQREFCSRSEFEVLFGGAAGPGKTDCLVIEATRYITHPRYRAIIVRRTFPQLQEIIDRCWRFYPMLDGEYRATEHRWYFPSGATIQLGHMQHEDDKYNYQGKEYHFIGFDEVTQFTKTQYLYLFSRCRSTVPELPSRIRATTNPGGIGHIWCKERFIDPMKPIKTYVDPVTGLSRIFIPAKIYDNPTLIENDPGYLKRLEALPEVERMRLLEGSWDVFEGQVFGELSMLVHGCDSFEVPAEWEKFMAFDWGYSKPFSVAWYALDYDGVLYRYREWYGCKDNEHDIGLKMSATDIARGIWEREKEKVRFRVADPACWNKRPKKDGPPGPSVVEDMSKEGIYFTKADNNRILGKLQVHNRLKMEEEIDPSTGEITKSYPRCLIFRNNKHFWRTMMELRLDPKNPEDVDTDQEDHIYDEFRYACMARPVIPRKKERIPPGSFMAERNKYIKAKKYAQRHGVSLEAAYGRVR